jgi:hypothetical protein
MRAFGRYILALVALVANPVSAADLPVGPVVFSLGSPRAEVLAEAAQNFKLVPVPGNPNTFFLSQGAHPNSKLAGGIGFKEGRLYWIQRNWGSFSSADSAVDVAKALHSALASATEATRARPTVTTEQRQVPGTEFRSTYFQFPGHKVSMTVVESSDPAHGRQVTVGESVSL